MDKALEMGKTSTVGGVQLFLGTSASTIIRAIGTIILGIFILPSDYGLYVVALIPASTLAVVQDWGMGSALTRFIAKYRATGNESEQQNVISAGLIYELATGTVLTLVSLLLANFFAYTMFNEPASALLIALVSVTMLSGAIASGVASIFTGFENMKLNSYLAVISAVAYTLFAPLLVYLGYGATGAIIGFTLSSVILATVSAILLYFSIRKRFSIFKIKKPELVRTLKELLSYGIPLGISGVVGSLGSPVFSFLMAHYVDKIMIGNYKIATNFVILLTFVTAPITTVLFPAFSKIDNNPDNRNLLKTVFNSSVNYTNILLVPFTMALIVLAGPLIGSIYGNKFPYAPFFLLLSVTFYLLSLTGLRTMPSLLSAMGETKLLLNLSILSLVVSIPVAFLLVPTIGITGIIIGLPLAAQPSTFVGLYLTWKKFGVKADFRASGKIFFASVLAALPVYLFVTFFAAPLLILLIIGSVLFITVYLFSAPLMGAINLSDVNNLRIMLSGLGKVAKPIELALSVMERVIKIRNHNANYGK